MAPTQDRCVPLVRAGRVRAGILSIAMKWGLGSVLGAVAVFAVLPASTAGSDIGRRAQLAFVHAGAVWTMAADGSARRRLTRGASAGEPAWSPSADRIAYTVSGRGDHTAVWTVDTHGHAARRAFAGGGDFASPAWSPDGRRLAVASARIVKDALVTSIAVSDPVGSRPRTVVELRATDALDGVGAPRWTPDGHLMYTKSTLEQGGTFRPEIHTSNLDGTGDRVFLTDAEGGSWSPDGRRFAYGDTRDHHGETCGSDECSPNAELAVVAADGSHRRVLTHTNADESDPAWSPDGRRIAFSSGRNTPRLQYDVREVYTITPGGGCLTWLTNGTPDSAAPTWSPRSGNTSPGPCGSQGRRPHIEVTPGRSPLRPLWLGRTLGDALLSEADQSFIYYEDCGAFTASRCPLMFSLTEIDTCHDQHQPNQSIDSFDIDALRRGHWIGDVRVGQLARHAGPVLVAGHTFIYVQIDSDSTRAQQGRLLAAIARALRPVTSTHPVRLGPPRLAQRFRRLLPPPLRARIAPCH